jgi:hypothetical protein
MSDSLTFEPSSTSSSRDTRIRTASAFYLGYAGLLLLLMIAGFGPSFFFRPLFDLEPLPASTLAHGVALTGWFVVFLAQAWLARRGQLRMHRSLGIAGVTIAVVGTVGFVWLALDLFFQRPLDGDAVNRTRLVRELTVFAAFPTLAGLAVRCRRKPDSHKRLMLLASISLAAPSVNRLFGWTAEIWPVLDVIPRVPATLSTIAALLAATVLHDLLTRGRVHPAFGWGAPGYFAWLIGTGFIVPAIMT